MGMAQHALHTLQSNASMPPLLRTSKPRAYVRAPHRQHRTSCTATRDQAGKQRGVVILPGLGNAAGDYTAISADLREHGLAVHTAPVERWQWLRNAAGLTDQAYWKGTLQPRPTVDWYLEHINSAIEESRRETGGGPVTLLAHSAGGWLARVYLLGFGTEGIDRLVTLGSPHNPPPEGVLDQTRGILTNVSASSPGNFHQEVAYVTIAGRYIKGADLTDSDAKWTQKVAGAGYKQVCGRADVWGDGITPVITAHLPGAKNITLDGVFHSPLGASPSAAEGEAPGSRPWYGSKGVLERWIAVVEQDIGELSDDVVSVGDIVDSSILPR